MRQGARRLALTAMSLEKNADFEQSLEPDKMWLL
jgi:hypothetical protein